MAGDWSGAQEACGFRRAINCLVFVGWLIVLSDDGPVPVGSHSRTTRIKLNEFVIWIAPLKVLPLSRTSTCCDVRRASR
jgi:hypothetical protein